MAKKPQISAFEQIALTHEKWARDLEACIPKMPKNSKAPIMREVAHHLECAARMRSEPILPLSLKEQQRQAREWRPHL